MVIQDLAHGMAQASVPTVRTTKPYIDPPDPCYHNCPHADCAMERGRPLPEIVVRAFWPDGTEYVPTKDKRA